MHTLTGKLALIALFILIGATFIYGIQVFLVVFAGVLFAVFIRSMSRWLRDHSSLGDKAAVIAVTLSLFITIGLTAWLAFPYLNRQFDELIAAMPKATATLKESISQYGWGRALLPQMPDAEQVANQPAVVNKVTSALRITFEIIGGIIALMFLGIFFALSPGTYVHGILALVPRRYEPRATEILENIGITLDRWLRGQLMSMAIVFVFTTLGLWLLGVKLALVLGIIAGLLAFIPNIGPIISAIPAILVGLLDSPQQAMWVVVVYLVVQTIESNIITPVIQNKMIDLPEAVVLASQLLMGVLLGSLALVLATPLAAVVLVLVKMLYVEDVLGKHTTLPEDHASG